MAGGLVAAHRHRLGGGNACGVAATPDLLQKTLAEATELANGAGLRLESEEVPNFLPGAPCLSQNPLPGIQSADGMVKVTVSRAPIEVQINVLEPYDPQGDRVENNANSGKSARRQARHLLDHRDPVQVAHFRGHPRQDGRGPRVSRSHEGATMIVINFSMTGWKGALQKITSTAPAANIVELGTSETVNWREPLSGRPHLVHPTGATARQRQVRRGYQRDRLLQVERERARSEPAPTPGR